MTDVSDPVLFKVSGAVYDLDMLRPVRWWLYFVALLVVIMVLVGGATRLTDSGLSITEWGPIRGAIPPLFPADWLAEFAKYQTTTEYQTINKGMSLDAFKTIYWWEWAHRFLGRLIGIVVLLPLIWFWVRGRLTPWLKPRLVVLLLLGGLQGAIGWWMVKSGLVNRVDVSQTRLAVHLTMACIILAMTVWLARSIARHTAAATYGFNGQAAGIVFLVLLQVFLGGLVAGLDAGMAYNTWPDMNGELVPDGLWVIDPAWKNIFDNALTVQFFHRVTAYLLLIAVIMHWVKLRAAGGGSQHARRGLLLFLLVCLQAGVGIVTLLMQVPLSWALAHQFGAIVVLSFAVMHWRALV